MVEKSTQSDWNKGLTNAFPLFIIPVMLWGYIASTVCAQNAWATVYDKLIAAFDLSPNQAWILPILINVVLAALGIPQVVAIITSMRRGEKVTKPRRVAGILCTAAVTLSFLGSTKGAMLSGNHLLTGARELAGDKHKDIYEAGNVANDIYSNDIIGVTIQLPKDWRLISLNAIRRAKHSRSYAATGNNAQQAEELAAERSGYYTLLAVRRYPDDFVGYNPSLVLSAYDKKTIAATGATTLEAFANGFSSIREPYHVALGPLLTEIGTNRGYHIHVEGRFPSGAIQQHLYITQTESDYIVLTASMVDEQDLIAMQRCIQTLQARK